MFGPCPERFILRRMDYLSDQEGILRRFRRERAGWDKHLKNTREFISESLARTETEHLVVLGSGWLLDLPLDELPESIQRISLIDVNFPRRVRKTAAAGRKIECIPADITGGYIMGVYKAVKNGKKSFTVPAGIPPPFIQPEKGKTLLSLNILNQLDILIVDYIKRKTDTKEEDLSEFRKLLQESHMGMLQSHPFILITDFREVVMNGNDSVRDERDLIFTDFPRGEYENEWDWMFDSRQLYRENANTLLKVRAVFSKGL